MDGISPSGEREPLWSGGGAATTVQEKLPEDVECSLDPTHPVPEAAHFPAQLLHVLTQPRFHTPHVLARSAVQIKHDADDDGGGIHWASSGGMGKLYPGNPALQQSPSPRPTPLGNKDRGGPAHMR